MSTIKITLLLALIFASPAFAAESPGVSPTEIKIGGVFPFSGPASPLGLVGKGLLAYVQMVNEKGGVNKRKINYIAYDDAYSPPKAVEHVRKLVESDEISFMYGQLGTPGNWAVAKYLLNKGVPSIGIISGSSRFTRIEDFPLTTTSLVSFETEAKIYARFLKRTLPNAKYAMLYQNDDLGKDYVNAFKDFFAGDFDKKIVAVPYEISDPTIDSQVVNLKSSGAEALVIAGTPKFATQAIRKAAEIDWKATIIVNYPSSSAGAVLKPAGLDKSIGVVAGTNLMDTMDPRWTDDPGMKDYRAFIQKYMPGVDIADNTYLLGYTYGMLLEQILRQCGDDLSRENILRQAKSLKDVRLPMTVPGITVNTSQNSNMMFSQLRLQRWTGSAWDLFTEVIDAKSK
jgi:branched-chain amino acid transport system substrate-binding protein